MKRITTLLLLAFCVLALNAKEKTFIEKFVSIYNTTSEEKLEITRMSSGEVIDSLKREAISLMGEELIQKQREIEEAKNYKEVLVTGGNDLTAYSDTNHKKETEQLLAGYEELLMIKRDDIGGKVLGKMKKDKITELIIWVEMAFPLPFPEGFSNFSDFFPNPNIEFIIDIPYIKPISMDELFNQPGDEESEDKDKKNLFLDKILDSFILTPDTDNSSDIGFQSEENTASIRGVKKVGDKYGLYNRQQEEILAPEYDCIEYFYELRKTDSTEMDIHIFGYDLTKEGKKGLAHMDGEIIFAPEYDRLELFEGNSSRYMKIYRNDKQGLGCQSTGELIIPIEYDNIIFRGDYLELVKGNNIEKIGWDKEKGEVTGTIER